MWRKPVYTGFRFCIPEYQKSGCKVWLFTFRIFNFYIFSSCTRYGV